MTFEDFTTYSQAINIIRASEMLDQITVSSYPHSKKEQQEKTHRELAKFSDAISKDRKRPLTLKEVAEVLSRGR